MSHSYGVTGLTSWLHHRDMRALAPSAPVKDKAPELVLHSDEEALRSAAAMATAHGVTLE